MKFTVEIEMPEPVVEIGHVYRVGDPAFFEIFVLVDGIETQAAGRWSVHETPGGRLAMTVDPGWRAKTLVTGIIQRGWGPTLNGGKQNIPPGTRWNTDSQWRFESVDWTEPLAAELCGPPEPPKASSWLRMH